MAAAGASIGPRLSARPAPLVVVGTVTCAAVLLPGYLSKPPCVGPEFDALGRSIPSWRLRINRDLCFSSIQEMWLGRDVNLHVLPYVHGSVGPGNKMVGEAVGYPVLTGLVMWIGPMGAHNDGEFLWHSALILAPFGLLTGALLFRMAGPRVVVGVGSRARGVRVSALGPSRRGFHRGGSGCRGARFVAVGPQAQRGAGCDRVRDRWRCQVLPTDVRGAADRLVALPATWGTIVPAREPGLSRGGTRSVLRWWLIGGGRDVRTVNVPFAQAGSPGWWASFQFQWTRQIDDTTNSIWFWGARLLSNPGEPGVQRLLTVLSVVSTMASMAAVLLVGLRRANRGNSGYPWLQASDAPLCVYRLCNKVNSPQFALWLLPFSVLARVRARWILAHFAADLAMFVGYVCWQQYALLTHYWNGAGAGWTMLGVQVGVWGRAALLTVLSVAFLRAEVTAPLTNRCEAQLPAQAIAGAV